MQKILFIYPPFWFITHCPHIALPFLKGQLNANNYQSEIIDLNVDFYNSLKKYDFMDLLISKIKTEKQEFYYKNKFVIDDISLNYKNKKVSDNLLRNLINIAFSHYIYEFPYQSLNYEDIKNFIINRDKNFFIHYYEKLLPEITKRNPNCISICICADNQLISALTLAHTLKTNTNIHVNIGGNYINRIKNNILKYPQFFDFYTDTILYGECESAIIEFAKYINKEISIDTVPNLIYKKEDKIVENEVLKTMPLSKLAPPDYSDLDLKQYNRNITLPLMISRGCYWNKCSFCDMAYNTTFSLKPIDMIISELKENRNNYNAYNYEIIDEAVPPKYLERLSDAIIENNLHIRFNMFGRLEKELKDGKILNKAYKAGLRSISWGLESANKRILKLINKGIDINDVPKILEASNKAGIRNHVDIFFCFPTETYKEAMDTVNFIQKNKHNIHSLCRGIFGLGRYCQVALNPKKYEVEIYDHQRDFSHALGFKTKSITKEEKDKIFNILDNIL